tara:strand:- start:519 stop:1712 length:1194 start_codon:yes stop_codon:yes gene_type:complete
VSHTVKKTLKSDRPGSELQGSIVTKEMVMRAIETRVGSEEFYELEPFEVLEVFVDDTVENFPLTAEGEKDYSYTGGVLGRFIYSEQNKPKPECKWFKPINPNINMTPVRGEIVIGMEYLGQWYYTHTLNCFGSPNANIRKNLSSYRNPPNEDEPGEYFIKSGDKYPNLGYTRRLRPKEGELLIEGRFNNSIRLGSNQIEEATFEESPNIVISVGHLINGDSDNSQKYDKQKEEPYNDGTREKPIYEDIDKDGSSIYLTTNEELKFTPAVESEVGGAFAPFDGKNILLDSDRIIFNTKNEGSVAIFSSNNIALSAVTEVVIETPASKLGSVDAEEPQVLGQVLFDKLDFLITQLGLVAAIPTPTGPSGPLSSSPNWTAVTTAMADIKSALSTKHLIDS